MMADTTWPWQGWLAGGVLNSLAADPGIGKTIVAMNLARVLWNGDALARRLGQPFPAGTRTLWVPADQHYQQLDRPGRGYGMPGESLLFNAPADEPTGGRDLDDRGGPRRRWRRPSGPSPRAW